MLFAAFTPQPGFVPPRKSASPWVIIAGVCGGCVLLVMIGAFVLTYIGFKKFGGITLRSVSGAQFFEYVKQHNYAKAETVLTPAAQAKFSADWLSKQEQQTESKLGPLEQSVSAFQGQHVKSVDDLNKIMEIPFTVVYEKGTRKVILHFDSGGDNKIADITWNADGSDGSENGAEPSGSESGTPKSDKNHGKKHEINIR